jgi:Uma2 family endonuclease
MSLKETQVTWDAPLSEWPVYYRDGLPFIYDDDHLFYDEYGEKMGQYERHSDLAIYLRELLRWYYRLLNYSVTYEITFRDRLEEGKVFRLKPSRGITYKKERPYLEVTPDIALVKGVIHDGAPTYHIGTDKPAPSIVFEIGSPSTYKEDLDPKFRIYEQVLKVREYIAYDPQEKRLWEGSRLKAWRLTNGKYVEIERNSQGWVWSRELDSWLVEDEARLRLYDADGNQRLLEAEEEKQRADRLAALLKEAGIKYDE